MNMPPVPQRHEEAARWRAPATTAAPEPPTPLYRRKGIVIPAALIALIGLGTQLDSGDAKPAPAVATVTQTVNVNRAGTTAGPAGQETTGGDTAASSQSDRTGDGTDYRATSRSTAPPQASSERRSDGATSGPAQPKSAHGSTDGRASAGTQAGSSSGHALAGPIPNTGSAAYYSSCAAVRAAGKAPLHTGDPGFRAGLDRDRDGVACESGAGSSGNDAVIGSSGSKDQGSVISPGQSSVAPQPAPGVVPSPTQARGFAASGSEGSTGGNVSYPNCAAARAAGVTPLHSGDPGYASHLDRDGDGVACE